MPNRRLDENRLVGLNEIAARLNVTKQRVHTLAGRPEFPTPRAQLAQGRVWNAADIERWIQQHRPDNEEE